MSLTPHSIIIVTPVYEDLKASQMLFEGLAAQFENNIFVVAVDDGSVCQPVDGTGLQAAGLDGVVLQLRRNVGHQKAIAIGLGYVAEYVKPNQTVVIMDSDGEDLPETIPDLLAALEPDEIDVVVAKRRRRVETLWFRIFYRIYQLLFRVIAGRSITFGNFMAIKAFGVKRLAAMQELTVHVAATVLESKLRIRICPIDRGPRYAGKSKMNFVGLALHGFKGLMVFAESVLIRVGIASAIIAGLAATAGTSAIILKALGYSTPGWASTTLGLMVLMLLQTGVLALLSLMLTGVVRSGAVTNKMAYQDFIDRIIHMNGPLAGK